MAPKIRKSNAPTGYKILRPNKDNSVLSNYNKPTECRKTIKSAVTKEAAYAIPVVSYNRPFEARLTTFNEQSEIRREIIKLSDGYYHQTNIFFKKKST